MRFSILAAGALAASAVVFASSSARAQAAAPAFGQAGEMALSWDQPLMAGAAVASNASGNNGGLLPMTLTPIGFQYYSVSGNRPTGTIFSLAPAADFFVIDNLSIGGQVMLGFVNNSPPAPDQSSTTTLYGIAPQIGYNIVISDLVSFWPKLFLAFEGESQSNNGGALTSGTLGIFAPFLFHIAPHFFLGIGPDVATQLFVNAWQGNQNFPNPPKVTTFGAMATVGGWFNL
jgi:hypothetical protein